MSRPALRKTMSTALTNPNVAVANGDVLPAVADRNGGWLRMAADGGQKAKEWALENPGKTAALGAGAVLVAAPMAAAAPVLGAFGFGANGIVAGSVAAGAQSGIGSVVAPSVFATLQSAAAGGYGVAAVSSAVQGLGGLVAMSTGAMGFRKKAEEKKDGEADAKKDDTGAKDDDADEDNAIYHESNDDGAHGKASRL
ncbi:hypothetical protein F4861DRAFT_517702 [Xylaria intraflava]|nr:hypothetical protein F4861DRAFT_517702 [Xylaria intraflava]